MNITQFAEQIVFGTTLEEKLQSPGRLTYDSGGQPSRRFESVRSPSRPQGMEMQLADASAVPPPGEHLLENEKSRGQLLHYLANHELLATELMALVLLKFPDAPIAFRRGVLVTLQEEQEHTRMYLRRMKECGVEFGSWPLSGQFWKIVEPMQSPMDFVSRLSLTFEQANLDYSKHFAKVFSRIGDVETSAVLQKIYEDEIGHVKHGLEWFRQWKDPSQSDWDAYQQALDFPMSPQRARGPSIAFNREGRIRAGLSESFVDAVEVFRQARSRTSTLRWFDAGAEAELECDVSAREKKLLRQLNTDLEGLMLPLAKSDDVILVNKVPSQALRKQWLDAGMALPDFRTFSEQDNLIERGLNDFAPWAWTPSSHSQIGSLVSAARYEPPVWNDSLLELFRKSWSAERLGQWLTEPDLPDWFVEPDTAGTKLSTVDQAVGAFARLANVGFRSVLVKQDLAASGRGQRRFDCQHALESSDAAWLTSLLTRGDAVVEPELDRVVDLSFLWHLPQGKNETKFLGWTRPLVTAGRRYEGTRLTNLFTDCDADVKRFLLAGRCERLQQTATWIQDHVLPELIERQFSGCFGVDALVCRDGSGQLKIKPIVELNARTTMGHVALKLAKRIAPSVMAELRILTKSQYDRLIELPQPAGMVRDQSGRCTSGVLWLSEVNAQTKLVPSVWVGDSLKRLEF